jgi:hypothetical protein
MSYSVLDVLKQRKLDLFPSSCDEKVRYKGLFSVRGQFKNIYVFVVYLTTLSAAQTVWGRKMGCLKNIES